MFSKKTFWVSLITLVLFTGISGAALAEMPAHSSGKTGQFEYIEQPLGLKIGVAIAGLGLIGLELWWFLIYKSPNTNS